VETLAVIAVIALGALSFFGHVRLGLQIFGDWFPVAFAPWLAILVGLWAIVLDRRKR